MPWPKGRPLSPDMLAKIKAAASSRRGSFEDEFWARVDRRADDECWPWLGHVQASGYGIYSYGARNRGAHRAAWQVATGIEPTVGLTIDHECHNRDGECVGGSACLHRRCVNPAHLRETTIGVNTAAGQLSRMHCVNGHPFSEANTYIRLDNGARECRRCRADAEARRRAKTQRPSPSAPAMAGSGVAASDCSTKISDGVQSHEHPS